MDNNSLSGAGKINIMILVDRIRRAIYGPTDNEQEGLRSGRVFVDQIFTIRKNGRRNRDRK